LASDVDNKKISAEDASSFIVPVNLHPDGDLEWIRKAIQSAHEKSKIKEFENICDMSEHITKNTIFYSPNDAEFDNNIRKTLDKRLNSTIKIVDYETVSDSEALMLSFILFMKSGMKIKYSKENKDTIDRICKGEGNFVYRCIYPLVISVDETRIKRDRITIIGYDILNGKKQEMIKNKTMITSKNLTADDYYCIPNLKSCGECGEWISNPLLILPEDVIKWKESS